MIEAPFQLSRHFLVFLEVVAVGNGLPFFEVDARPDDVEMFATVLFVGDDDARLVGEPKLFSSRSTDSNICSRVSVWGGSGFICAWYSGSWHLVPSA